jgi:hypothetical protein
MRYYWLKKKSDNDRYKALFWSSDDRTHVIVAAIFGGSDHWWSWGKHCSLTWRSNRQRLLDWSLSWIEESTTHCSERARSGQGRVAFEPQLSVSASLTRQMVSASTNKYQGATGPHFPSTSWALRGGPGPLPKTAAARRWAFKSLLSLVALPANSLCASLALLGGFNGCVQIFVPLGYLAGAVLLGCGWRTPYMNLLYRRVQIVGTWIHDLVWSATSSWGASAKTKM